MPTPSDDTLPPLTATTTGTADSSSTINSQRSSHPSCPPDSERRSPVWRPSDHCATDEDAITGVVATATAEVRPSEELSAAAASDIGSRREGDAERRGGSERYHIKTMASGDESSSSTATSMTPESMVTDVKDTESPAPPHVTLSPSPRTISNSTSSSSLNRYEFSTRRLLPNHTSSFLRAGSKFNGTQQSDRQVYDVQVEIKHVDMEQSYLCGFLRIQGLTEDHPTLTTFFEGEIIGTKHTFQTKHPDWGATDKTDMQHWARFSAWRPLAKKATKPDFTYRNYAQRENIFMRWKEHFLVPDHRVTNIHGASFEGFYYICFNQVHGTVSGIYFHAKSEKYQQLELRHVEDRGCFGAMEFR